ncbi:hypothetical protein TNIN_434401 [Trichonephila inaurata madagascariensis]|uniref:Uncharacterized protein n=1 Tax=Trichonephila inaurata madagascariensis TaxID=2747483 RepID=A0A8X6Y9D3_9ARAC|nr:hypothetical protein TNIN_434401 [Trichonephila inaurata madagascariensis]
MVMMRFLSQNGERLFFWTSSLKEGRRFSGRALLERGTFQDLPQRIKAGKEVKFMINQTQQQVKDRYLDTHKTKIVQSLAMIPLNSDATIMELHVES